jgi:large subunit ribosomal protein L47
LTERYYSWRDAEDIARNDPEIDLSGNGPLYTPTNFMEEEVPLEEVEDDKAQTKMSPDQTIGLEGGVKSEQRLSA